MSALASDMEAAADGKKRKLDDKEDSADKPTTRSERYYDPDADLTIITSDNVEFRIHAYLMQTHSAVLRDMIGSARNSPINLSDTELETELVLTAFLDVMVKHKSLSCWPRMFSTRIIQMAIKYDCQGLIGQMRLQLHRDLPKYDGDGLDPFMLGLQLDDKDLCLEVMRRHIYYPAMVLRYHVDTEEYGECLDLADNLDPTSLELDDFRLVKPDVLWAWLRAHRAAFPLKEVAYGEERSKVMRDEFERLLQLPGAPENLY